MLVNKERMLQKMEQFNLDVLIASHPENVSYLADFQSHLPYMYRFLNVESFALFPRDPAIAPALIIGKGDVAWAARYPSWMKEVYTFGNDVYFVYPEGTLSDGEKKFKDDPRGPGQARPYCRRGHRQSVEAEGAGQRKDRAG